MSSEGISTFFDKLDDQTFDDECQEAMATASLDAMVRVGAKHGLEFTAEELAAALEDRAADFDAEIGDDELDAVAGGIIGDTGLVAKTGSRGVLVLTLRSSISSSACPPSRLRG